MLRIGMFFGGRSVEHGVSVVTASQVMAVLDRSKYEAVPVYLTADGDAYLVARDFDLKDHPGLPMDPTSFDAWARKTGRPALLSAVRKKGLLFELRSAPLVGTGIRPVEIDIAWPLTHGTHGEDGTLQGLLELADVPYVGSGVVGSAVCMDKAAAKAALRGHGFPVVDGLVVARGELEARRAGVEAKLGALVFPVFVKPASLGSSIAVTKAKDVEAALFAIEVALYYDQKCLVEPSVEGGMDINCAVLGGLEPVASVCERPLAAGELLSYADKYLSGGKGAGMEEAARRLPADIPDEVSARVQSLARDVFQALGCGGVARIDFLVCADDWSVVVNEVNTIPGSFSLYLWEASGMKAGAVVDAVVGEAQARHRAKQRTLYSVREALSSVG